jgi:ubiquinone/menaquinone biosynthesis C-methylase UbiE
MVSQFEAVNRAFSKQSFHYDQEDHGNIVLRDMRAQVYNHVDRFIKPNSFILELNAGTGIDALRFVNAGHRVHATDLSDGMIAQIKIKMQQADIREKLNCQQLSYDQLEKVEKQDFDYVFSNFGGLNCIQDLSLVTRHLPAILKPGAYVSWVIMPPVCAWELLGVLKGHGKKAFRRFRKEGVRAHLEGEYFTTYYHSLSDVRSAFGTSFKLVACEGLAALSPQPHHGDFPVRHPALYRNLRKLDSAVRDYFPFNRWADHIIVTFRYTGDGRKIF